MIHRINLIVFLLFYNLLLCQNEVIEYEYVMIKDKNSNDKVNYKVFLEKKGDVSYFFSEALYQSDSIIRVRELEANKTGSRINFKGLPEDPLKSLIKKDFSKASIEYFSNETDNDFLYKEKINLIWNIHEETKFIEGVLCNRATTFYMGRNWIAWFAEKIPIPDGPYKFNGLPGLILEVYDREMNHKFTYRGFDKNSYITIVDFFKDKKYKELTKEKFSKYIKNYKKAPMQQMINIMRNAQDVKFQDRNGNSVDVIKKLEESQKRLIELYKNENRIEN